MYYYNREKIRFRINDKIFKDTFILNKNNQLLDII